MKITIYAEQVPEVRSKLDRLAKKAAKYGAALSYSIGPEHPELVRVWEAGEYNGQTVRRVAQTFHVAACDVEIDGEELIRQSGWTVRAHIAHENGGNIVTAISGEPDPAWWSIGPRCDHCGKRRARSATYIVQQEGGSTRQVGKSCLRDYTGIDPAAAALWASVRDIDTVTDDMDTETWAAHRGGKMYPVETVLALACDSIRARGYRKSDTELSTRATVLLALARGDKPTAAAAEKAAQIVAWLDGLSPDTAAPLERDCKALVSSGWVHPRHVGRLVYIPVAFDKRRPETPAAGAWVGEPGQRIVFTAAAAELVTSWEGDFGTVRLYKFRDDAGNVYTWRASKAVTLSERMTVKGTIKDHAEYKGERQTALTRCAVS